MSEKDNDQNFNRTWAFKGPVKVDKSISKNIAVNYKGANGFSLDSITITPFNVVVNSTNSKYDNYYIRVFDDNNNELGCDMGRKFNENKEINYFSAIHKGCKSLRIVVYKNILEKGETVKNSDGSSSAAYKYVGDEILIDKSIIIE